jgi:hypothetical protein
MSLVAISVLTPPDPIQLTYDFVKDVSNTLDQIVNNNQVHRDADVKFISQLISNISDQYKINAGNEKEYAHQSKHQHFIRVLRYGVMFKYLVMLKLPDGTIESFTYEY